MILHVGLCGARARADQGHRLGLGGGGPRHSRGGDAGGGDGERRRAGSESVDAQNGVPFRKSAHCRSTLRAWYINCTKSVVLIVLVGKEPGTRFWLWPTECVGVPARTPYVCVSHAAGTATASVGKGGAEMRRCVLVCVAAASLALASAATAAAGPQG